MVTDNIKTVGELKEVLEKLDPNMGLDLVANCYKGRNYCTIIAHENKMKKYVVVGCEHSEKTEVPVLCGTFNTRPAAEDFIENAINKSLKKFKNEERLDDNGVVIYDDNGAIFYSCIWTILEIDI